MALVKSESTLYTCDFCGEVCTPVKTHRYTHSYDENGNKLEITFKAGGYIPIGNVNPDVCKTCAMTAAQAILAAL
jgi:hypothetical protein